MTALKRFGAWFDRVSGRKAYREAVSAWQEASMEYGSMLLRYAEALARMYEFAVQRRAEMDAEEAAERTASE